LSPSDFAPRISTWASSLVMSAGFTKPPVDLFKVARLRQIHSISIRPMIPRGGLLPIKRGFAMYVRGQEHHDMDTPSAEPGGFLTRRQRFTVAHEIAHTFFYDLTQEHPAPHSAVPRPTTLEAICDQGALFLLMPTQLLRRNLPDPQEIDIAFVRELARAFNVSLTVTLSNLGRISAASPAARCILLVRRVSDNAEISAVCFGTGLLRTLPRPARFTSLRQWLPGLPAEVINRRRDQQWEATSAGRAVLFRKVELGSGSSFLLQVEEAEG
jgi:hypothetical protein